MFNIHSISFGFPTSVLQKKKCPNEKLHKRKVYKRYIYNNIERYSQKTGWGGGGGVVCCNVAANFEWPKLPEILPYTWLNHT